MTSVNIKSCLTLLIKILKIFNFSDYLLKDFQIAKFDDSRAYEPMLRLVFELSYFDRYTNIDDVCYEAFKKFKHIDVHIFIYNYLKDIGYPLLTVKIDDNFSSRKLLIIASWILFNTLNVSILFKNKLDLFKNLDVNANLNQCEVPNISNFNSIQQLIWFFGDIRFQFKQLHQLKIDLINLYFKNFESFHLNLSPLECWLPYESASYKNRIDEINSTLLNIRLMIAWYKIRVVLFQWIENVFKIDKNDCRNLTECSTYTSAADLSIISDLNKEFNDSLVKYSSIANNMFFIDSLYNEKNTCLTFPVLFSSIDDDFDCINNHIDMLKSDDVLTYLPFCFKYNFVECNYVDINLNNKFYFNFELSIECCKMKSLLMALKNKSNMLHLNLEKQFQTFAANFLPNCVFVYYYCKKD